MENLNNENIDIFDIDKNQDDYVQNMTEKEMKELEELKSLTI